MSEVKKELLPFLQSDFCLEALPPEKAAVLKKLQWQDLFGEPPPES